MMCTRCHEEKLVTEFRMIGATRSSWCLVCHQKYSRQLRAARTASHGDQYRDKENRRVREHLSQEAVADRRNAADRARRAALRELALRHPKEFRDILRAARKLEGL